MGLHTRGSTDMTWYEKYFGQLVGATITGFTMAKDEPDEPGAEFFDHSDSEFWPRFTAVLADGREVTLELSQDEEGNGPGWMFGLEFPEQVGG